MAEQDNFTPWASKIIGAILVVAGGWLMAWAWSYSPMVMQDGVRDFGYGYTSPDPFNQIAVFNAHRASDRDVSVVGGGFLLLSGMLLLAMGQVVEEIRRLRPAPSEPAAAPPQGE